MYYSPEEHGLTVLVELDEANLSYEFNMLVVWEAKDGRLFWAQDSGCSCPSPFEDYHTVEDLTPITKQTLNDFLRAVDGFPAEGYEKIKVKTSVLAKV